MRDRPWGMPEASLRLLALPMDNCGLEHATCPALIEADGRNLLEFLSPPLPTRLHLLPRPPLSAALPFYEYKTLRNGRHFAGEQALSLLTLE